LIRLRFHATAAAPAGARLALRSSGANTWDMRPVVDPTLAEGAAGGVSASRAVRMVYRR